MLINEEEKNNDISKGYGISPPPISAEPQIQKSFRYGIMKDERALWK
ncbi:7619_t:CDS:2 [Rhizophagus irregularis]|nr:7619_t:CDS:2 [Rhizophagus irregularis]